MQCYYSFITLTFIIGNENLKGLDLSNLPKSFESEHQIKVRGQFYTVKYGVFFNREKGGCVYGI